MRTPEEDCHPLRLYPTLAVRFLARLLRPVITEAVRQGAIRDVGVINDARDLVDRPRADLRRLRHPHRARAVTTLRRFPELEDPFSGEATPPQPGANDR